MFAPNFSTVPFARSFDPATSHDAARRARSFSGSHAGRILEVLRSHGPATAEVLADRTGLTVVQIDRRLPDLKKMHLARVVREGGEEMCIAGFRIWEAA